MLVGLIDAVDPDGLVYFRLGEESLTMIEAEPGAFSVVEWVAVTLASTATRATSPVGAQAANMRAREVRAVFFEALTRGASEPGDIASYLHVAARAYTLSRAGTLGGSDARESPRDLRRRAPLRVFVDRPSRVAGS